MVTPRRRAILHIGTGKTGTTSIQVRLKAAREELLRRGYCYPQTWGPQHHSQLVQLMDPARHGALETEEGEEPELPPAETVEAAMAGELQRLPEHVHSVVYSSELLYGNSLTPGGVARLKASLDAHFDRYMVICYIRRQDERAVSGYSTLLKDGHTWQDPLELSEGKLRLLDYAANLAPWAEAFGLDSMLVRVFERDALLEGDVVTDFLRVTGIGHLEASEEVLSRNPSLSAPALEFLRRVNEALMSGKPGGAETGLTGTRSRRSQRLRRALVRQFAGPGMLPARERAEAFYARFQASNAEVLARFFPGRERLFSEDFSRYPETARRPTEAEVLEVATAVTLSLLRDVDRLHATEQLRRAREAAAGQDPARAHMLYMKAIAGGDEQVAREAQEGLTALSLGAEDAARLKWRMTKGAASAPPKPRPATSPAAAPAGPGGGGAKPGGPGQGKGGPRPGGPGGQAAGGKPGGSGQGAGGPKPGGPQARTGGAKPGGQGPGGPRPGGPGGPKPGGMKPGGPGPGAGGPKPGGPHAQAGGPKPGGQGSRAAAAGPAGRDPAGSGATGGPVGGQGQPQAATGAGQPTAASVPAGDGARAPEARTGDTTD